MNGPTFFTAVLAASLGAFVGMWVGVILSDLSAWAGWRAYHRARRQYAALERDTDRELQELHAEAVAWRIESEAYSRTNDDLRQMLNDTLTDWTQP